MILVDTGYLIAIADRLDHNHGLAKRWASVINEPLVVIEYVLIETVNSLSKTVHRPKAWAVMDAIFSDPTYEFIPASSSLLEAGMAMHRDRGDKEWPLTDCISFHLMEVRKISRALAHDHHFQQAGFEALHRSDPPS